MTKYFPMLLLAAAIGCTQGGAPDSVPDSTADISTESTDVALDQVEFYCPGMT